MRMMDALGFPPPSKLATRGPGHADPPGLDSCSQDSRSSCGTEPAEVRVEDAESSSGPDPACSGAGTESKEDCRSEPCETTAVPHASLHQENSQDGEGEGVRLEPNAGPQTDLCVSVPQGATTASLGQDDGSAGLGADVISGRVWRGKGNNPVWRGKGDDAEGDHQTAGSSADHTLPEGPVRRDGSAMDAQGQTRSAHRGKMHEKGRRPPVPEAPKSSLLHEQHLRYLHLFQKCTQKFFSGIATRPTPDELQELQEFESLQLMVCQEQEQCQNHLKQVATCNSYLYTHLPSHAAQYIQEREERGWRRVENYCRYYAAHSQLSLVPDMSQPAPGATPLPALTLLNTLLELDSGSKCKVVMPDLNSHPSARVRRTVCTDLHKVTARFPTDRPSNPLTWNHETRPGYGAGICVDASASTPTDCFQGQGHTTALSPARRITRSLSHRLQSPEAAGERSGCLGDSDVGHTSALPCDSDGAVGSLASPRTRQGLKRRGSAATRTSTVCEEGAQGKRGRRGVEGDGATVMTSETNADRTQGKAAVGQSTGPCLAPSLPARQNKGTGKQSTETAPSYLDSLLKEMTPLGLTSKVTLQEAPGQYKHPGCSGEHMSYQHWNLGGMREGTEGVGGTEGVEGY
ncbi:uncharacterized protein LOC143294230 [Babylonia areolata]|uniref:uncharacterized protein LOC143294230 n=1 Tax=Babylonia areolata TaxID=304850 RepID=UPI003FD31169